MAKRKVKWGVSKDEPEDLQDFQSNDEIVAEHGEPKAGPARLRIKRVTHVTNSSGDPMLKILAELDDPKRPDHKGYAFFENQNVTDSGERFLKRFLNSMGASWADFRLRTIEDTDQDPVRVVKIGSLDLSDKGLEKHPVFAWASIYLRKSEEYGDGMNVRTWLIRTNEVGDEDEAEEEAEVEEEEAVEEVDEEAEEDEADEEADEDEEEDEEVTELREELDGLNPPAIRKRLRDDHGWKPADYKGFDKAQLIDAVVGETFGEEADEDEESEEEGEEGNERFNELNAMKDPALKKILRDDHGYTAADYKGSDRNALIALIMEEEDEGEPPF